MQFHAKDVHNEHAMDTSIMARADRWVEIIGHPHFSTILSRTTTCGNRVNY